MVLELPKELTIAHAVELKALLLSALERGEPLELSARAVVEVDVAGLQLLYALGRSAQARKLQWDLPRQAQSPALIQGSAAAGIKLHEGEATDA